MELLAELKSAAVTRGDQDEAKRIWCFEMIAQVHANYVRAFDEMRAGSFYEAWCRLERVEIDLNFLSRHHPLADFSLEFIATQTSRFQQLFPYKLFFSPGLVVEERRCGLCNAILTARRGCPHRLGEIYDGEMCFHEISKARAIEVSIVTKPVEKSCVGFVLDPATREPVPYDYRLVAFVVERLASPFNGWDLTWTKTRHPHSFFSHVAKDERCPCESGRTYEICCLGESGVLRPHCQITFEVEPTGSPLIEYVYGGGAER